MQHDSSWFRDSGATHQLTNASPLSYNDCVAYNGQGKVIAGNGSSLNISAIGYVVIPIDSHIATIDSHRLFLHNMLYISSATKNILYVSQFAKDNKAISSITPHIVIRDSQSHKIPMHGYETLQE